MATFEAVASGFGVRIPWDHATPAKTTAATPESAPQQVDPGSAEQQELESRIAREDQQNSMLPVDPLQINIAREEALLASSSQQLSADDQWLLARQPQKYTLQVLGASTEQSVRDFISRQGLDDLRYYRSTRQGG